jgi:hypothetical protein
VGGELPPRSLPHFKDFRLSQIPKRDGDDYSLLERLCDELALWLDKLTNRHRRTARARQDVRSLRCLVGDDIIYTTNKFGTSIRNSC